MEEGGLCMLAWKKRTGLGGSIVVSQKWERRWIVVTGNKMVYYSLGKEDAPKPRGVLDLVQQSAMIHVPAKNAPDAPTPHELDIVASSDDGSAPSVSWKLCFDTQQDQLHLLETVHNVLYQGGLYDEKDSDRFEHDLESGDHVFRWEMIILPPVIYPIQIHGIVLEAGRNCVIIGDFGLTGYGKQEGASFNHAEDHNVSIMAAWKKLRPKEDQRLNIVTLVDPKEIRKWKKANYDKSTTHHHSPAHNIGKSLTKFFSKRADGSPTRGSVMTDATVVGQVQGRERTDTSDSASSSVSGRLSKFFSKNVIARQDSAVTDATVVAECGEGEDESGGDTADASEKEPPLLGNHVVSTEAAEATESSKEAERKTNGEPTEVNGRTRVKEPNKEEDNVKISSSGDDTDTEEQSSEFSEVALSESEEPSSADAGDLKADTQEIKQLPSKEQRESFDGLDGDDASSAVADHHKESTQQQAHETLPKSDPKKIVLARAHFLLEYGEEILPPYHVFYSNSECIAVWCKTGRWSTLQTAVYLTGHSVGAAKSSTMATLGVAAAHAVFAPVVAVGGLIWVSAPMVILQKSRKKWDEATMKLTGLFWDWAPNEVFVEAIENWSDIS